MREDKYEGAGMDDLLDEFMGSDGEKSKEEETDKNVAILPEPVKEKGAKPRPADIKLPDFNNKVDESKVHDTSMFEPIYEEDYNDLDNEMYDDLELDDISDLAREIVEWEPPHPRSTEENFLNEWLSTGWVGYTHLDQILTEAAITGASDVHITADQHVAMSRLGEIIKYDGYAIPDYETMHGIIHDGILSHQQRAEFNRSFEYDGSYTIKYGPYKGTRTRLNIGKSFGKYFLVFRIINDFIPSIEDLQIEQEIINWSYYPNGLFLLCGPTGTGKSTTLASVVHNIMRSSRKKIVTIEKPIEYIYPDDTPSLVVQREVGEDTLGFYEGLTSAMRQNPDIILLGEVRNTEEVTELLRAAETGHLAISTMHTSSVATTINRIQNLFSGNEQKRIMSTLADSLRGVGNQVLVKDMVGGRFAVRELLTVNEEIKRLIVAGDAQAIRHYQISHEATMEHKLAKAVKEGRCLKEEAFKQVSDPTLFRKLMEVY